MRTAMILAAFGTLLLPAFASAKSVEVVLPYDKNATVAVVSARSVCSIREQAQHREVVFDGAQLSAETQRYLTKRMQTGATVTLVVEMHRFTVESGRAMAGVKMRVGVPAWLGNPKADDDEVTELVFADTDVRGAASETHRFPLVGVRRPDEIAVSGGMMVFGRCDDDRAKDQAWATARLKVKLVLEE